MKILEHVMLSVNSRTFEMMDAITCSHFQCMLARDKKIRKRNSNAPQTMSERQEVTRTQCYW